MPGFTNDDTQEVSSPYAYGNGSSSGAAALSQNYNGSNGNAPSYSPSTQGSGGNDNGSRSGSGGGASKASSSMVDSAAPGAGSGSGSSGGSPDTGMKSAPPPAIIDPPTGRTVDIAHTPDQVTRFQSMLASINSPETGRPYYFGKVDGRYGPDTTAAVVNFQNDFGLTRDGLIGVAPHGETGPAIDSAFSNYGKNAYGLQAAKPAAPVSPLQVIAHPAFPSSLAAAKAASAPTVAGSASGAAFGGAPPTGGRYSNDLSTEAANAAGAGAPPDKHEAALTKLIAPYAQGSFGTRPAGSYGGPPTRDFTAEPPPTGGTPSLPNAMRQDIAAGQAADAGLVSKRPIGARQTLTGGVNPTAPELAPEATPGAPGLGPPAGSTPGYPLDPYMTSKRNEHTGTPGRVPTVATSDPAMGGAAPQAPAVAAKPTAPPLSQPDFSARFGDSAAYAPQPPTNPAATPAAEAAAAEAGGIAPPHVAAFGDALSRQGVEGADYNTALVIGKDGAPDYSKVPTAHAFGKYQFLASTYREVQRAHPDVIDTSPASQDKAFAYYSQETYQRLTGRSMEADLAAGKVQQVARTLNTIWPSLTGGSQQGAQAKTGFFDAYQKNLSGGSGPTAPPVSPLADVKAQAAGGFGGAANLPPSYRAPPPAEPGPPVESGATFGESEIADQSPPPAAQPPASALQLAKTGIGGSGARYQSELAKLSGNYGLKPGEAGPGEAPSAEPATKPGEDPVGFLAARRARDSEVNPNAVGIRTPAAQAPASALQLAKRGIAGTMGDRVNRALDLLGLPRETGGGPGGKDFASRMPGGEESQAPKAAPYTEQIKPALREGRPMSDASPAGGEDAHAAALKMANQPEVAERMMILAHAAGSILDGEDLGTQLDRLKQVGAIDDATYQKLRQQPPTDDQLRQMVELGKAVHDMQAGGPASPLAGAKVAADETYRNAAPSRPASRPMGPKPAMYNESDDRMLDRAIDMPATPTYHEYPERYYERRKSQQAAVG